MMRNLLLASVALFTAIAPAFPADVRPTPDAFTPAHWAGFYAGPTLGWATGNSDGYYQGGTPPPPPGSLEATIYGIVGLLLDPITPGALAGYNFQLGNVVAGPEVDLGWIGARGRKWAPDGSQRYDEIGVTWNGHARGRIGHVFGPYLPYVAGGVALAGFEPAHFRSNAAGSNLWTASDTRIGYTVGGGVEVAGIIPGWMLRGEYLYDHFGRKQYDWVPGMRYSVMDLTMHTLRAAVTYRFSALP
jgi:outer membrane immunogenic protein